MMASGQRSTDPSSAGGAEAPGLRSPRTRSHGGGAPVAASHGHTIRKRGLHGRSHRPRGSQRRCAGRIDHAEHRWPRRTLSRSGTGGCAGGQTTGPSQERGRAGRLPPSGAGGPRTRTLSTTTDGEGASQTRKRRALEFPQLRGWRDPTDGGPGVSPGTSGPGCKTTPVRAGVTQAPSQ